MIVEIRYTSSMQIYVPLMSKQYLYTLLMSKQYDDYNNDRV